MTSHLLLIEDDDAAAYITLKVLKSCGFKAEIDVVVDGLEAMEYLCCQGRYADRQSGNPSLILLDLKLPNLDGFEVLKQTRVIPSLSTIPVFILSASKTEEDVHRSNLLGISKYLTKPLDMDDFRTEAAKLICARNPKIH